jgi:3-deoxy-D-manno-octulosonate 8-phosphate phosphatase KdsC-like HAD superfamily phosphatase
MVPLVTHRYFMYRIEKVQIKVVNMISGLSSRTYEDRLKELGIESLAERRHQADMVMVHKTVHCTRHR